MTAKKSKVVSKAKKSTNEVSSTTESIQKPLLDTKTQVSNPVTDPIPTQRRECGFDLEENCTVFVRNLPYGTTVDALKAACLSAASDLKIQRIYLVKDATGQPRGTAFVKLSSAEDADRLIELGKPRTNRVDELSSFLGNSKTSDAASSSVVLEGLSSGITVGGRLLYLMRAERPDRVQTLKKERVTSEADKKSKSRNIHLLAEGHIESSSEEFSKLSVSEKRQRELSWKERQYKISNPNFFVSDTRVSFRNLPLAIDQKSLKQSVVQALNKKSVNSAGILKATVIVDKENNNRSKGFGFVDFKDHESALACVRTMNNRPELLGKDNKRSPIVEFTIEDKRKLKILEAAKAKHRAFAAKHRSHHAEEDDN